MASPYNDEQMRQQAQAQKAPPSTAVLDEPKREVDGGSPYSDQQMKAFQLHQDQPPSPTKPVKRFDLLIEMNRSISPYLKFMGNELQIGSEGVHEGIVGAGAMVNDSFDAAEAQLKADREHAALLEQQDQTFADSRSAYDAFKYLGAPIRALPLLGTTLGSGFVVSGTEAAAGALLGAGVAAPTGEVAAPVTIPVGAVGGALNGFNVGMFTSAASVSGGAAYLKYRRQGLSHSAARTAAASVGLVNGLLSVVKADKLVGIAKEAVVKQLSQKVTLKAIGEGVTRYLKEVGLQGALGGATEAANAVIDAVTGALTNRHDIIPSLEQTIMRIGDAVLQGVQVGAVIVPAAAGLGAGVRRFNTMRQNMKDVKHHYENPVPDKTPEPTPPLPKPRKSAVARTPKKAPTDLEQAASELSSAREEKRKLEAALHHAETIPEPDSRHVGMLKKRVENAGSAVRDAEKNKRDLITDSLEEQHAQLVKQKERAFQKAGVLAKKIDKAHSELNPAKAKALGIEHRQALSDLKDFTEMADSTGKQVEARRNEDAKAADKALSDLVADIKPSNKGGTKYSQVEHEGDRGAILKAYAKYIKDPELAAADALSGEGEPEIAADVRDSLATTKGKEHLAATLRTVLTEGKSLLKHAQLKARAARIEKRNALVAGINTAPDPKAVSQPEKAKLKNKNAVAGLTYSFQGKVRQMLSYMPDGPVKQKLKDALNPREIVRDCDHAKKETVKATYQIIGEHTGESKGKIVDRFRKGATQLVGETFINAEGKKETGIRYTDLDGQPRVYKGTANQAAHLLNQLGDKTLTPGFEKGNRINVDEMKTALTDALNEIDPNHVKQLPGVRESYAYTFEDLNDTHVKQTGIELEQNPDYAGYAHRVRTAKEHGKNPENQADFEASLKDQFKRDSASTPNPSFTKVRTHNELPIETNHDISQELFSHQQRAVHYTHWMEPSREDFGVFNDPQVTAALDERFGPDFRQSVQEHVKYLTKGRADEQVAWANHVSEWLAKLHFAKLATKPLMFVKHYLSMATAIQHMPAADFIAGVRDYYNHFNEANKLIGEYSKQYQVRNAATTETFSGAGAGSKALTNTEELIQKVALSPIREGSNSAVLPIMWSATKYYMRQGLPVEKAISKAEEIVERTQVSGAADMRSNLSRQPVGKWLTMFHQQLTHFNEENQLALDEYIRAPEADKGAKLKQFLKTSALSAYGVAVFPLVDYAYITATASNEKDKHEALFRAQTQLVFGAVPGLSLPVIQDAAYGSAVVTHNAFARNSEGQHEDYHLRELNTIPLDVLNNAVRAVAQTTSMAAKTAEAAANGVDLTDKELSVQEAKGTWRDVGAVLGLSESVQNSAGAIAGSPVGPIIQGAKLIHKNQGGE